MTAEADDEYVELVAACDALAIPVPILRTSEEGLDTVWLGGKCIGMFVPAVLGAEFLMNKARSTTSGELIRPGWFLFGHSCPNAHEAAAEIRAHLEVPE